MILELFIKINHYSPHDEHFLHVFCFNDSIYELKKKYDFF